MGSYPNSPNYRYKKASIKEAFLYLAVREEVEQEL